MNLTSCFLEEFYIMHRSLPLHSPYAYMALCLSTGATSPIPLFDLLRLRGAIPPLSQYVFVAWSLVKHRDNFYLNWLCVTHM
jgi:hypothetical protein